jgi:hypothetical protein
VLPLWDEAKVPVLTIFPLDGFKSVVSSLASLLSNPHNVFRRQRNLLKQKLNYVTSLLKILKWFPMEAVSQKLFLAAKSFLQMKI